MDTDTEKAGAGGNGSIRILLRGLSYAYPDAGAPALSGIDLTVRSGEYLAVLGANGSGKSTLLKCLNGLCAPEPGHARVYGDDGRALDPADPATLRPLRALLGTVLQNPDDQIVGTVVEEDCAFGPENLGLRGDEAARRVDRALAACGLSELRTRPPQFLSGGERRRLSLAGILAMEPRILALDEATSMIDPSGRAAFLDLLDRLVAEGRTVLTVTHSLEEAARARRCLVLHRGAAVFDGTPWELFEHGGLEAWGFHLPDSLRALGRFSKRFPGFSPGTLEPRGVAAALVPLIGGPCGRPDGADAGPEPRTEPAADAIPALRCAGLSHRYLRGTEYSAAGVEGVDLVLERGRSLAVIGTTGSGKSTLLKHLNAVLLPTEGTVELFGMDTRDPRVDLRIIRKTAALAVQHPEAALFEPFVADDVAYGPRNAGVKGAALRDAVRRALGSVGLPYDVYADRYIRSLSGGEKRRVALAGVLALEAPLTALDEPTAALDGSGGERILALLQSHVEGGGTVVATTHSMEEAARFDLVAVMEKGRLTDFGPPREVFSRLSAGSSPAALPWAAAVYRELEVLGACPRGALPLNAEELVAALLPPGEDAAAEGMPDLPPAPPSTIAGPAPQPCGRGGCRKGRRRRGTGIEFFRNVTLGQFLDRPSPLRSVPAGPKLSAAAAAGIAAAAAPHPAAAPVILATALAAGTAFGRVGPKHLLRGLLPAIPYLALMAALQFIFAWPGDGSRVLFALGPLSATAAEAERAFLLIARLAALMAIFSLFSAVTPPSEAIRAAGRGLAPLSRLGLPVREFSLILGIALRFVPVLAEEAERIVTAQLSRGGGYGGKGRLRAAAAMTVPLFLRALERSEALAAAMELRLFDTSKHPS